MTRDTLGQGYNPAPFFRTIKNNMITNIAKWKEYNGEIFYAVVTTPTHRGIYVGNLKKDTLYYFQGNQKNFQYDTFNNSNYIFPKNLEGHVYNYKLSICSKDLTTVLDWLINHTEDMDLDCVESLIKSLDRLEKCILELPKPQELK